MTQAYNFQLFLCSYRVLPTIKRIVLAGELSEAGVDLTPEEIAAIRGLAGTTQERQAIAKRLALVKADCP